LLNGQLEYLPNKLFLLDDSFGHLPNKKFLVNDRFISFRLIEDIITNGIFLVVAILVLPLSKDTDSNKGIFLVAVILVSPLSKDTDSNKGIFLVAAILVSPLSKDTDSNNGTKSVTQTFKWYRYLTKLKTDLLGLLNFGLDKQPHLTKLKTD
jgi:hypothetical protein